MKKIHEFDNGVKVYDDQLELGQRKRYAKMNVHEEDEEPLFLRIIENLPSNATFVNIGAAIGYYPILARKLRNDLFIHCFEPLPRHSRFFQDNIKLNGLNKKNLVIHEYAVSNKSGSVLFEDHSYGSSIKLEIQRLSLKRTVKNTLRNILRKSTYGSVLRVDAIRLIDVFNVIGTHKIDFLQMDIQGFEESVLREFFIGNTAINCKIKAFLVGTHTAQIHGNCRSLFENNGYTIIHDEYETQNQPDGIIYCSSNGGD